jgi:hypothetical protein
MRTARMLLVAAVLFTGCGDSSGPPTVPGINVVGRPILIDTIDATTAGSLVVEIRDADNRAVRNALVTFAPETVGAGLPLVQAVTPQLRTDATGRVATRLRFGRVPGDARLVINAEGVAALATIVATIRPGGPIGLRMFSDTTMFVGDTIRPLLGLVDRLGNPTTAFAARITSVTSPLVLVRDSLVTANTPGTGRVRVGIASLPAFRDSLNVTARAR